jgi:hypothetical protein
VSVGREANKHPAARTLHRQRCGLGTGFVENFPSQPQDNPTSTPNSPPHDTAETAPHGKLQNTQAEQPSSQQEKTTHPGPALPPRGFAKFFSSPTASTLRANPYPEVTDPICRFPLPTFIYRLEAVHLGDLMRISVRAGANVQKRNPPAGFSRASRERPRTPQKRGALRDRLFNSVYPKPYRSTTEFHGLGPSSRKENSSRGSRQLLRFVSRYRDREKRGFKFRFSRT